MELGRDSEPIPIEFNAALFPPPEVSIKELLNFRFPYQDRTASTVPTSSFFTRNSPITVSATEIQLLQTLPIPALSTLNTLDHYFVTLESPASASVVYAHLPIDHPSSSLNFPSWILPYWLCISRLRCHAVLPWKRAEQWLANSLSGTGCRDLVADARQILRNLSWTGNTWSFTDPSPLTSLAHYLSQDWFGTTHISQQLDLLRHRLTRESSIHEFDIFPTYFVNSILEAYHHHQPNYSDNQ